MRYPLLAPVLLPALLTGCSLLIDVEPDCDAARDCNGYLCNDAGTACLNTCAAESDCTAGYACDESSETCRQVASLEATPVPLSTLPRWGTEFAVGAAGSLSATEVGLVVGGSEGLGFARFSASGSPLASTPEAAPFGLDRLAPASSERALFRPAIGRSLPSSLAGGAGAALVFGWAEPTADRNRLFAARRTVGAGEATSVPTLLRDASRSAALSQLSFAAGPDLVMALWREQSGASSELRALPLAGDSLAPILSAAERLTGANEVASDPAALRMGDRWAALYLSSALGARTVRVIALESDASQLGELDLTTPVANTVEQTDLVATETAFGAAAAYLQLEGGEETVRGLFLPSETVAALGDAVQTAVSGPSFAVSETPDDLAHPAIASVDGEVAIAWVSVGADLNRSIMLRRFSRAGQPLSPAGPVVANVSTPVVSLHLAATANGYALVWFEGDATGSRGFWLPLGR